MEYSLELNSEKIYFEKTKKNFKEVLISYNNGCYRSAIVNLYIVTLTDLIYRFEELDNQFKDGNSKTILKLIEDQKEENKYSPHWEKDLIKETFKTSLLSTPAQAHIETLVKLRHLCAHPIIDSNYDLYIPKKETTRAIIQDILIDVLTTKIVISSKIDSLINDFINEYKNDLQAETIAIELNRKYFSKCSTELLNTQFKKYWKFTFFLDDSTCSELRPIHTEILHLLYNNYNTDILKSISKNKDLYSKSPLDSEYRRFFYFLNRNEKIYHKLDEPFKVKLNNILDKNFDYKAMSIFYLDKSNPTWLKTYLTNIINQCKENFQKNLKLSSTTIHDFYYTIRKNHPELNTESSHYISKLYAISPQFDHADSRFSIIEEYTRDLSIEDLKLIVEGTNKNNQIHSRIKAKEANLKIKNLIDERVGINKFPYKNYPNFKF